MITGTKETLLLVTHHVTLGVAELRPLTWNLCCCRLAVAFAAAAQ